MPSRTLRRANVAHARRRRPLGRSLSLSDGRLTRLLRAQDVTCKLPSRTLRRANVAHARRRRPLGRSLSLFNSPLTGSYDTRDLSGKLLRCAPRLSELGRPLPGCSQNAPLGVNQRLLTRCDHARNLLPQTNSAGPRLLQRADARACQPRRCAKKGLKRTNALLRHLERTKLIRRKPCNLLLRKRGSLSHKAVGKFRDARNVLIRSGNLNRAAGNKAGVARAYELRRRRGRGRGRRRKRGY